MGKTRLTGGVTFAALTVALLAAGCGTSATGHTSASRSPVGKAAHAASSSAASVAAMASTNERRFAYWLAGASPDASTLSSAISGPVMQGYAQFESLLAEANAAAGNPGSPETVSTIPGGYQDCGTGSNGNTVCDSFTGFRTDAAGRITDLSVDGQLISARLAVGKPATGSQLAISDVFAYRAVSVGEVLITYKARNITSHVVGNGNPAFLAAFDPSGGAQFQQDDSLSTIPSNLQPGESDVEFAAFATHTVTGQFSLRSNDGYMSVMAASTLKVPTAPTPATPTSTATSSSPASTVRLACKVLQTNTGEEFNVATIDGATYQGTVYVSFYGQPGSGQTFPNTIVHGASITGTWRKVPSADIGASAEPVSCSAATR